MFWIIAFLVFLAGASDFTFFIVKNMNSLVGGLTRVTVPGTVELTLLETGTYTIFVEAKKDSQPPSEFDVTLTSQATGASIPLTPVQSLSFYFWEGRIGMPSHEFQITVPGVYELMTRLREGRRTHPGNLTIGRNWGERFSKIFTVGGIGLLAWLIVGSVIAAIPYMRKKPEIIRPTTLEARASTVATPVVPSGEDAVHRINFHGSGGELFGIFIVNVLLTILTIGIFSFWAKVKTRRYVWGQTEFAGDRFGFHGTGKELLIGWIKAATLFGGLLLLTKTIIPLIWDNPVAIALGQLLLWGGLIFLIPLAIIGSMRYRLSRTSWRGVRFSFHGQYQPFLGVFIRGILLSIVTLGLYSPFYQCQIRSFLVNNSSFGSASFRFEGTGRELWKSFAAAFVGSVIGLPFLFGFAGAVLVPRLGKGGFVLAFLGALALFGWIWTSYFAKQRRYYWDRTSFAEARFHSTVTAGGLFRLYVTNLFLVLFSLGLAIPWATVRTKRYDAETLTLQGPLALDHITQQAQSATPTGEELSGFLDIDVLPG